MSLVGPTRGEIKQWFCRETGAEPLAGINQSSASVGGVGGGRVGYAPFDPVDFGDRAIITALDRLVIGAPVQKTEVLHIRCQQHVALLPGRGAARLVAHRSNPHQELEDVRKRCRVALVAALVTVIAGSGAR